MKKVKVIETLTGKILFDGEMDEPKEAYSISIDTPPFNLKDYIVEMIDHNSGGIRIYAKKEKR